MFKTKKEEVEVIKPKDFTYKGLTFKVDNLFINKHHDMDTPPSAIESSSEMIFFKVTSLFLIRRKDEDECRRKVVIVGNEIKEWLYEPTRLLIKVNSNYHKTIKRFTNEHLDFLAERLTNIDYCPLKDQLIIPFFFT